MEIRRARAEEAEAVADLWLRSRRSSAPAIPPPVHTDDEVRSWFETVVLPSREVWVSVDDGRIAALLVLDDEWIDQLYVHPDRTGQGIGGRLVDLAELQRPSGLRLWTFAANGGARRFYEAHGFVATASTAGDNEEGAPDVHYEWRPEP